MVSCSLRTMTARSHHFSPHLRVFGLRQYFTDDYTSDIGTKALAKAKFEAFRRALGIVSLSELVAEMKPAEAAMMRAKLGV